MGSACVVTERVVASMRSLARFLMPDAKVNFALTAAGAGAAPALPPAAAAAGSAWPAALALIPQAISQMNRP